MTKERAALYSKATPPGDNMLAEVALLTIDGSAPQGEEVEWEVHKSRKHLLGRPSGMREDHLQVWLAAVT